MICTGEFEPGMMIAELMNQEAFAGIQGVSTMRSTHRNDGSLVTPEPEMEAILLKALGVSEDRHERLLRLKEAIESGRYFVSANDLADRLIDSMLLD